MPVKEQTLVVGERTYRLEISAEAETLSIRIDGVSHEVAVHPPASGRVLVSVDGMLHCLHTARSADGVWVWSRGRARLVRSCPERDRVAAGRPAPKSSNMVTPLTPSMVAAILVEQGQEVREGQEVVVLSAMKMETRLVAPRAGVVAAVNASVGASVRPGDCLVEISPLRGEHGR